MKSYSNSGCWLPVVVCRLRRQQTWADLWKRDIGFLISRLHLLRTQPATAFLPLHPADQDPMRATANVAEADARSGEPAERAQVRHVVDPVGIREVDVFIGIVQIHADLEPGALLERPRLGYRCLRPDNSRRCQRVASQGSGRKRRRISKRRGVEIRVLQTRGKPVGPDGPILRLRLIVGQDLVRTELSGQ